MTNTDPHAFSALLRRYRLAADLTQEALAERAGLSVRGISDLERGVNRAPYVATVVRLSDALQLSKEQRVELESTVSRRRRPSAERHVTQLPEQFTSLVGRERDVEAVIHVLRWEGKRLVTLTGPGGVGKTRLAIEVAATIALDFEGGAIFVPLEEVTDAGGVRPAIAAAIGLRDEPGQSAENGLVEHLSDRELFLVLDGFEHLMDAATFPAQLLIACPRLKVLISSRAPLHVRGEQEFEVRSLPIPDPADPLELANLEACPSVALFVERAQKVKPGFVVAHGTAPVIAEICCRLDGLPLAIELAAARIKLLSPDALLLRLEQRLNVLTGGPRDMQPRQQTMRRTIAWSHDLLAEDVQALFRRISVFNAPFGVEAAGAVFRPTRASLADAQDALGVLTDGSLLAVEDGPTGEPRFSMLETVREYGLEMLSRHGERDAVRESLAEYCVGLAERAENELHGADQRRWMARLEREHGTILLVLHWSREPPLLLTGLRIAAALWRFWYSRGYLSEGRRHLEDLLSAMEDTGSLPLPTTAKAARGAAVLAATQGDYARAETLSKRGLDLYLRIGDVRGEAAMLVILGSTCYYTGDYVAARARFQESLDLFRAEGDEQSISVALNNLANIAKDQGRTAESVALYEESLAIKRQLGDSRGIAIALNNLGTMSLALGQHERAAVLGEEALTLLRNLGDKDVTAAIDTVARAALQHGDSRKAAALYREGLAVSGAAGDRELIAFCLEGAGYVSAAEDRMQHAAMLYGAADALRTALGAPLSPPERAQHAASLEVARTSLGGDEFARAWDCGVGMSLETAIAFASGAGLEYGQP